MSVVNSIEKGSPVLHKLTVSKFRVWVEAHLAENSGPRHPNFIKQSKDQVNCKTAFRNHLHLILKYSV